MFRPSLQRLAILLAAGALYGATSGQSRSDEIVHVPFTFEHNEIIVSATIKEEGPNAMLLDTDSNPSVVSLALAQRLGLKLHKIAAKVSGGGTNRPDIYLTKLPLVELGGAPPKDLQALAMDLHEISARLSTEVQGVLGHNFLPSRILQIDYPNESVPLLVGG